MKDAGSDQSQDDFAVEITDLDKPGTASHKLPRASSRRYRLPVTVETAGMIALALLIILETATPVRELGGTLFARHTPTPIPTLFPGEDLFYIRAEPPWGHLMLDGQVVRHLPDIGVQAPLRLSGGRHTLIWQAEPFSEQQCLLSVPVNYAIETCTVNRTVQMRSGIFAFIVTFSESLDTLPDIQRSTLVEAARQALDTQQSTDDVRVGERYVLSPQNAACRPARPEPLCYGIASQLLKATLRFQLDTNPASPETCLGPEPGCTFLNQSCYVFCSAGVDAPGRPWVVFAPVLPLWTFTTSNGSILERDVPDNSLYDYATGQTADESLVTFSITWDNLGWHVAIPRGANSQVFGFPFPACAFTLDPAQPFIFSADF